MEILAPYLMYLEQYLPAITLAGLFTYLLLSRWPTNHYADATPNMQFWMAFVVGALITAFMVLASPEIVDGFASPATLVEWAFVLIVGGIGPKVFYHLAEGGEGVLTFLNNFRGSED